MSSICENILYEIQNRKAFRAWLSVHHKSERECWVLVRRGFPKENDNSFWYIDAVEEALCFGWIDSVVKKADGINTMQRFSPRKKNSQWSELNKERCLRLEKLGLMTQAGRNVLPDMENFVIDSELLKSLQSNKEIWENFQRFHPLYQRVRIDNIQRVKSNQHLYNARLQNFLNKTKLNIMFGSWNDNGRLV